MAWTQVASIPVNRDWHFSEPVSAGTYFRLKHTEGPIGAFYAIALCDIESNGNLSIGDTQVLEVERGVNDLIKFPKGAYAERRIAIRRIDRPPSLEQEIRRLFLSNFLIAPEQVINYIKRNSWVIEIEASDYVEIQPSTLSNSNVIGFDSFTDTENKILANHNPEIGSSWITSDSNWKISNNRLIAGIATGNGSLAYLESSQSNLAVECWVNINKGDNNTQSGLILRAIDNNNYWLLRYIFNIPDIRITKVENGTQTDVAIQPLSLTSKSTYLFQFKAINNDLVGYIDEVEKVRFSSNDFSTATKAGVWNYESTQQGITYWNDFKVLKL